MSARAMGAVWENPSPNPRAQLVLLAVAWRELPSGTAEVSQATLARMTGLPKSTVQWHIRNLLEAGHLETVWGRPGARSRYRINLGEDRVTPIDQSGDGHPVLAEQMALPVDNTGSTFPELSTGGQSLIGHRDQPMHWSHEKGKRKEEEPTNAVPVEREVIR